MTTFISTGPAYVSTNAQFQSLATSVAQALQAIGLVKTGDTGQMNTATIVFPAGISTSAGYEIRRFDDALQGSYPIYIRWEAWRGAATNDAAIRFRFGTGTDGAGNLTNEWYAANNATSTVTFSVDALLGAVGSSRAVWATAAQSAAEARASLIYAPDPTQDFASVGFHMAVQRTVDSNGVPTGDGFFAFVGAYNPLSTGALSNYDMIDENFFGFGAPAGWRGSWAALNIGYAQGDRPGIIGVVPLAGIGVSNGVHYPTPWTAMGRSRMYPPLPDWLLYHKQVIPIAGTNFTVKRNGVNRTFRATGQSIRTGQAVNRATSTNSQPTFDWRLAVIWE
jgi:hypothetical protein